MCVCGGVTRTLTSTTLHHVAARSNCTTRSLRLTGKISSDGTAFLVWVHTQVAWQGAGTEERHLWHAVTSSHRRYATHVSTNKSRTAAAAAEAADGVGRKRRMRFALLVLVLVLVLVLLFVLLSVLLSVFMHHCQFFARSAGNGCLLLVQFCGAAQYHVPSTLSCTIRTWTAWQGRS